MEEKVDAQWICLECKTVIGPVWDDDENRCSCGVYEFAVVRMIPDGRVNKAVDRLKRLMDVVDSALQQSVWEIIGILEARQK